MNTVMIDNWTLGFVFEELLSTQSRFGNDTISKLCMANLLTGIVLWDKLYWSFDEYVGSYIETLPKNDIVDGFLSLQDTIEFRDFEAFGFSLGIPQSVCLWVDDCKRIESNSLVWSCHTNTRKMRLISY